MATLVPCVSTRLYFSSTATLCAITALAIAPKAEQLGHQYYHDTDYRYWKQPGTEASCCSDQDCAPVRAELREGHWFALRQSEWSRGEADEMGRAVWDPLQRSEWIAVPDEKIIRVPNPAVEGGHLCYLSGKVVCFVPPNTGG
jgi:hypothetical protein